MREVLHRLAQQRDIDHNLKTLPLVRAQNVAERLAAQISEDGLSANRTRIVTFHPFLNTPVMKLVFARQHHVVVQFGQTNNTFLALFRNVVSTEHSCTNSG